VTIKRRSKPKTQQVQLRRGGGRCSPNTTRHRSSAQCGRGAKSFSTTPVLPAASRPIEGLFEMSSATKYV
jgi:hypothetical protein